MEKLEIISKFPRSREYLLLILHELQRANPRNYLEPEDLRLVAEYLDLPLSAVHDTVTFYSMFSLKPRGRHVIRLCDSPLCHLAGSRSLLSFLMRELGIGVGETTPDGVFTLELTPCLGACGVAPAMMVDEEIYGNLDEDRVREILDSYREGR
ncbi:NADH-quinone oxidoreductase subunit NuoE family protein [Candidatus Bipolaricaulota sp. J31]